MIKHIAISEPDEYPSLTLCGHRKRRQSRLPVPLACNRCLSAAVEVQNGADMKTIMDGNSDPYQWYRDYYKALMTKAATAMRQSLKFGGR